MLDHTIRQVTEIDPKFVVAVSAISLEFRPLFRHCGPHTPQEVTMSPGLFRRLTAAKLARLRASGLTAGDRFAQRGAR
jgi:hypothetical protein